MNTIQAVFLVVVLLPTIWLIGHWSANRPPHPQRLPRVVFAGCARVTNVRVAFLMTLTAVVGVLASRAGTILVLWVALVLALGKWGRDGPGRERHPFFTPALHLGAVRSALHAKANARRGDRVAGDYWGLTDFRTSTNQRGDQTVSYYLPDGVVASDVIKARDLYLSRVVRGVPSDQLIVDMDHEVNRLRVTIKAAPLDLSTPRRPDLTGHADVEWTEPFVIGRDIETGDDVTMPTFNIGQMTIGGMIGSGKSVASRLAIAHFARVPDAKLWVYDGKGDYDDLDGPLRHRCQRFMRLGDDDSDDEDAFGVRYLAELETLRREVRRRNNARGRNHPPLLVVLEEAPQLRLEVRKGNPRARHDELLRLIVNTCRSANVFVLVLAQKPSASQWPTDVRSQQAGALCLRVENVGDAQMVLGRWPDDATDVLELPDGHGIFKAAGTKPRRVVVDYLDDATWQAFCATLDAVAQVEPDADPQDAPLDVQDAVPAPEPEADELLTIVQQVLRDHGPVLTCTGILDATDALLNLTREQLGESLKARGVDTGKRTIPGYGRGYWVALNDVDMALAGVNQTA